MLSLHRAVDPIITLWHVLQKDSISINYKKKNGAAGSGVGAETCLSWGFSPWTQ